MSSTFLASFYAFLLAGFLLKLVDELLVEFRSRQRDKKLSQLLGHLEDFEELCDCEDD